MQDVSIKSRTTAPLVLSFIDDGESPVSIGTATEIRFGIKESLIAGLAPLVSKTLTGATLTRVGDTISIPFLTGDWNVLPPGQYVMDVDITIGSDVFVSDTYLFIVEPRAAIS
jgi:hypothetical protein